MKRLMTAVCMAGLMGTVAAAQMGSMPMVKAQSKTGKANMAKKPITVTGCVAAGTDPEHFTLTKGVMTGETTGKSYDLMGGELKAHLGHRVAVTGTMETMPAKDNKDKMKPMPNMEKEDKMGAAKPHSALHVTSVKMLAATCPNN